MTPSILLLIAIVALLIGLALGWLAANARAAAEKARLAERVSTGELLRLQLDEVTRERNAVASELAAGKATQAAQVAAFERELATIREAKDALSAQFSEVGARLLADAQRQFLERADQRFTQADEKSGERLKALLNPVETTLKRYEENVGRIEKERTEAYGNLTGLISAMRDGQEAVRGEAARLVNALRAAPKARGRWGEQQLRNVLETCGLAEHTDFAMEVSVATDEGARLRPDAIVRVPGGRSLVIDAKVSLNAYQDAYGAATDEERMRHLATHAAAMKAHITGLSAKAYWSQFADAPDYVIMFVPGEHFLAAALESDATLWDYAFDRRVLLSTPTNLVAIARTVSAVWRQEKLAKEAQQIGALGKEMHERLAAAAGHLRKVGSGLTSAVGNYNAFVSSFESRVMVTGRKFRDLNIETGGREIEEVVPVEALPRGGAEPLLDGTAGNALAEAAE